MEEFRDESPLINRMLNNSPLFRALLFQEECACTLAAGCPLEQFIFAEFIFCLPFTYVWRIFKHWHGLRIQRWYIAAIYPTISKAEINVLKNRGNFCFKILFGLIFDGILLTKVNANIVIDINRQIE